MAVDVAGGRAGAVVWPDGGWVGVTRRNRDRDDDAKAAVEARLAALAAAADVPRRPDPPDDLERAMVEARLAWLEAAVGVVESRRSGGGEGERE